MFGHAKKTPLILGSLLSKLLRFKFFFKRKAANLITIWKQGLTGDFFAVKTIQMDLTQQPLIGEITICS
jgi:hypothetical protein